MPSEKLCYYVIMKDAQGADRIRFGPSPREESQVTVTNETWQRLCLFLTNRGFRMIEVQTKVDDANDRGSKVPTEPSA